jgi:glycosyltransferase involved in cell wall biosynthesis
MPRIAFILKGYPRLSETFIAQEILALEQHGLDVVLYSLRFPTDPATHEINERIKAPVAYLPEYLYQEPMRLFRAFYAVWRQPGFKAAWRAFHHDLIRDPTPNRVRRFGQAMVLACELVDNVDQLHAHFIHTPGSVARYAALIRGLPWSVSAHAKDIWTLPDWEKREKLAECAWAVTCTATNRDHLAALAPEDAPDKVELVYHGLDFTRFPKAERPDTPESAPDSTPESTEANSGRDKQNPIRIVSVGRAVVKKGYDGLLQALAALPEDLAWRFSHVGGGPLRDGLMKQAEQLGIADRIDWRGALVQTEVLAALQSADIFVLASKIAPDGDRDGLPNVLMEAQSQGVACLSTAVSAIPELIEDGVSGLLVPPDDVPALGSALQRLIADPALRLQLGTAGLDRVRNEFSMDGGIDRLMARFNALEDA